MSREYQPCCYYPTEVVFIDDNDVYLKAIYTMVRDSGLPIRVRLFDSINLAIAYINGSAYEFNEFTFQSRVLRKVDTFSSTKVAVEVDVSAIHKEIYNEDRFFTTSTLVVDYDLGRNKKNGVDLCKNVADQNIRKILLTSNDDLDMVINAFNNNYIHYYIGKRELYEIETVFKMVLQAQKSYFQVLSEAVYEAIDSTINFPVATHCAEFRAFFKTILEEHKILEYYLLDQVGSYLLIDEDGNAKTLHTQNIDQQKANLLEIEGEFSLQDKELDNIKDLRSGKLIFCNNNFFGKLPDVSEWKNYFVKSTKIFDDDTNNVFFCALTNEAPYIDKSKLISYKQHIQSGKDRKYF